MKHYVFRTTSDKLPQDIANIESVGDHVLTQQLVDDRHWVLLCTHGEPTVADLTAAELRKTIADGVRDALRAHDSRPGSRDRRPPPPPSRPAPLPDPAVL